MWPEDEQVAAGVEVRGADGALLAVSDATGRVDVPPAAAGEWERWTYRRAGRRLHTRARLDAARGVMPLWSCGRTVQVRFEDPAGRPIAGAAVLVGREQAIADADGCVRLTDVSPSQRWFRIDSPDWLPETAPDSVPEGRPGERSAVTVRGYPAQPCTVTVTDLGGRPIAGAVVGYTYPPRDAPDAGTVYGHWPRTGPDGTARLRLPPGEGAHLEISADGYRGRDAWGLAGAMPDALPLALQPARLCGDGPWIPVACQDAETGAPLEPTLILVRRVAEVAVAAAPMRATTVQCHPDEGAEFDVLALDDLPAGAHEVMLWHPGYRPALVVGDATTEGVYPPLDARLHRDPRTIAVRLVEQESGAPMAERLIFAAPLPGQGAFLQHSLPAFTATTDADGRATLHVPPGRYEITADLEGWFDGLDAPAASPVGPGDTVTLRAQRVPRAGD